MSKKSEILVLGTIAFDEIITPTAISGKILGGSASYISMSIFFKKLKSIISIVGNDFPKKHLKMFEAKDIDISGVQVHKKEKTFYWKGLYGENVNERETLQTNVNALLGFTPNLKEKHRSPKIIVLGNISPTAQLMLLMIPLEVLVPLKSLFLLLLRHNLALDGPGCVNTLTAHWKFAQPQIKITP